MAPRKSGSGCDGRRWSGVEQFYSADSFGQEFQATGRREIAGCKVRTQTMLQVFPIRRPIRIRTPFGVRPDSAISTPGEFSRAGNSAPSRAVPPTSERTRRSVVSPEKKHRLEVSPQDKRIPKTRTGHGTNRTGLCPPTPLRSRFTAAPRQFPADDFRRHDQTINTFVDIPDEATSGRCRNSR